MKKSTKKQTKNNEYITKKGGALKFESYPNSDAGKIKIKGVNGVRYFNALWKYFIDIYKKTGGKDKIIDKLSNDTTDLLNYFNTPGNNNMLILDYNHLDYYSITLQIINKNNGSDSALTYYIIINFPQDIHLTIHFNRSYRIVKESVLARDDRAAKRASVKGDKSTSQKTNIYEFVDKNSILTPIHLTSNTKYRSYYMSIDKINELVKYFIKVMPKGYDEETYINQIIPCVFIGSFCSELVELMSSSFIINRIGEAIEKYLNNIIRSGQNINKDFLLIIISKIKEIIDGERKKANDSNAKLYISLNSDIDMLIEYHINANGTITQDTITDIKSILYGIEGYKDINTFLYDTKLVRGTSDSVRSNVLKDLSRYFTNQADFDEYCEKYYKGNMRDCDKSSISAKDVMGNVVDKINQDNVILSIGNFAVTSFIKTISFLHNGDIKCEKCITRLLELSNEIFVTMNILKDKYGDTSNLKTLKNLKNMLTEWLKYKTQYYAHEPKPKPKPETKPKHEPEPGSITSSSSVSQPNLKTLSLREFNKLKTKDKGELFPQYQQLFQQQYQPQFQQQSLENPKNMFTDNELKLSILNNMLEKQTKIKTELYRISTPNENDMKNINIRRAEIDKDIYNINREISHLQQQQYGGSKVASNVINRYLDKIKEIRTVIKNLNDNKKKNKSKILTKRMQIKNLYSKIKIQRENRRGGQ